MSTVRLGSDDTACFAFSLDPETGRCTCRHDEEHHEGTLGGCEICAYDLPDESADAMWAHTSGPNP